MPRVRKVKKSEQKHCKMIYRCFVDLLVNNNPSSRLESALKNFNFQVLQGILKKDIEYENYSLIEKALIWGTQIIGSLFTREQKLKCYELVFRSGNDDMSEEIKGDNGPFDWLKYSFPKTVVREYIDVSFEGKQLMMLRLFDKVLVTLYGDYMTPPEKERIPKHIDHRLDPS